MKFAHKIVITSATILAHRSMTTQVEQVREHERLLNQFIV